MAATRMPAMEAVVHVLKSEGVDVAYGCPGAAVLPLYKAMDAVGGIDHLTVRHEEGATHMADGWARTTGKVGVAIGTSGPAGTNMVTGLSATMADSVPIICITGRAASADSTDAAKPIAKWAVEIEEAEQAPKIFREAFRIARSGRPGPVLIDIRVDIAQKEIWYDPEADTASAVGTAPPRREDFAEIPVEDPRVRKAIGEVFDEDAYFVTSSGPSSPLGWVLPAAIGVRTALSGLGTDNPVVAVLGDCAFPYMVDELSVAAQYNVPYVIVLPHGDHDDEYGSDNVKIMQAYGCSGTRVRHPDDIRTSLLWARKQAESTQRPVLVELTLDRGA